MFLSLFVSTALADLAPPPDYVEECTVAIQCREGEQGRECRASYNARDTCDLLLDEGWERRCKTNGRSVWSEVFCRADPGVEGGVEGAEGGAEPDAATEEAVEEEAEAAGSDAATEEVGGVAGNPATAEESGCSTIGSAGFAGLVPLWLVGLALARRRA